MRIVKGGILLVLIAAVAGAQQADAPPWGRFFERLRTDQYLQKLSASAKAGETAFIGSDVIPMTADQLQRDGYTPR